jgi:hypothetical protein
MEEKIYTTKEAADLLSVNLRAVQSRCAKENILRRSNRYVITDEIIERWKERYYQDSDVKKIRLNAKQTESNAIYTQDSASERNLHLHKELKKVQLKIELMDKQIHNLYDSNQSINKVLKLLNERIDNIKPLDTDSFE